jgi:hypothetical protein
MTRPTLSRLLFIGALFFAVTALATLVPYPNKMISDLGYFTLCPFAPYSTLTLLFLGALCWAVRAHIKTLPAT